MRSRNPNNNGGNRKGPNPLTRSYESNGPDVKIRGNAHHVAEKYLQLARDAQSSGDPVAAESYLQHAEHYFRLIASAQQAQSGQNRQLEDADLDGDDDDSGIPDRFASPQPAAPFVPPQPTPLNGDRQPYTGDRQPYTGDRPAYADRQNNNGADRQPYADRPNFNGDRPQPSQDRNGYDRTQRQDRNGMGRNRPYRENGDRSPEIRTNDTAERQERNRHQDRPRHERGGYDRNNQDRAYRDPAAEQPRDIVSGEQPRIEGPERLADPVMASPRAEPAPRTEPVPRTEPAPRVEAVMPPEPQPRIEPVGPAAPQEMAVARAAPSQGPGPDEASGLPSFITTPTRLAAPAEGQPEPNLASPAAFPGEEAAEVTKFPRRRRRPTRAAASEAAEPPIEGPAGND